MIVLQNVCKTFNAGRPSEFCAVRDVNLTIAREKITVVKGPSGSGKTTLLSLVGCMVRPTSGRIFIGGRETTSLPERFLSDVRRSVFGFIFQNYNLIKGITVLENTMLPAYPTGRKYREVKAEALQLLARLDIASKAGRKVEQLSGGEQQRTAIARALINNPAIIIADEPTAHLDIALSREFLDIAAGLAREKKTVLMASHDPVVFGAGMVDAVVGMRDGRIVEERRDNRC